MQNNTKNVLLLALVGVAIGVTGLIAYYQQISWLFILCTILCIVQFAIDSFLEPLKDEVFPYLATCLAIGYYLTDNILDTACFGICLYYATALFFLTCPVCYSFANHFDSCSHRKSCGIFS